MGSWGAEEETDGILPGHALPLRDRVPELAGPHLGTLSSGRSQAPHPREPVGGRRSQGSSHGYDPGFLRRLWLYTCRGTWHHYVAMDRSPHRLGMAFGVSTSLANCHYRFDYWAGIATARYLPTARREFPQALWLVAGRSSRALFCWTR